MTWPLIVVAGYGLVGLCAARYGYSKGAYQPGWLPSETGDATLMTSRDPRFRPCRPMGFIFAAVYLAGWPLLTLLWLLRRTRPWGLLDWCASPDEKAWRVAQRDQRIRQLERDTGIHSDAGDKQP